MYTNVTIVLNNTIPSSGRLEVLFTNVTIHDTFWKLPTNLVGAAGTNDAYCFVEYIGT